MATRRRNTEKRRFYEQVLSEAERADIGSALHVSGVDEELATLRLRLRTALKDGTADLPLLLRGLDVLRRLVATRYGLSRKDLKALDSAFARETLRRLQERAGEGGDEDDAA